MSSMTDEASIVVGGVDTHSQTHHAGRLEQDYRLQLCSGVGQGFHLNRSHEARLALLHRYRLHQDSGRAHPAIS